MFPALEAVSSEGSAVVSEDSAAAVVLSVFELFPQPPSIERTSAVQSVSFKKNEDFFIINSSC